MKLTITDKTLIKDVCDKMLLNGRARRCLKEYLKDAYEKTTVEEVKLIVHRRSFRSHRGVGDKIITHLCFVLGVGLPKYVTDSKKSCRLREAVSVLVKEGVDKSIGYDVCTILHNNGFNIYRNDKTCR